jgi:hypothetical protein
MGKTIHQNWHLVLILFRATAGEGYKNRNHDVHWGRQYAHSLTVNEKKKPFGYEIYLQIIYMYMLYSMFILISNMYGKPRLQTGYFEIVVISSVNKHV